MAKWPAITIKRGDLDADLEYERFAVKLDIRIWLGLKIIKFGSWLCGFNMKDVTVEQEQP